jgi:hypothetical protein
MADRSSHSRKVKKFERAESKESMMVRFHEDYASGAPVSVCDRDGESAASAAERISAGGEQNPSGPSALPSSVDRSGTLYSSCHRHSTLAVIGKRLGRRGLETIAASAKPDTILAWFRKLVAQKFDASQHRLYPGRPTIGREITELIVRLLCLCTTVQHEANGGDIDERLRGLHSEFVVFAQSPIAPAEPW